MVLWKIIRQIRPWGIRGWQQGRIQDFKLGVAVKKIAPSEGRRENIWVFRVKNHDFTPKNHIFPILGVAREIFGVFHGFKYPCNYEESPYAARVFLPCAIYENVDIVFIEIYGIH